MTNHPPLNPSQIIKFLGETWELIRTFDAEEIAIEGYVDNEQDKYLEDNEGAALMTIEANGEACMYRKR